MAQIGGGVHYAFGERSTVDFRAIHHHISNANISQDNPSLNSLRSLVGVTFLY